MEKLRQYGTGVRLPDDPLFADGNNICRMYMKKGIINEDNEELCHRPTVTFQCHIPNCGKNFTTIWAYELHYNSCHRFVCSECRKNLASPHLLDLHITENHDSFFQAQAEKKSMYRCFVETCDILSSNSQMRRKHCIEVHKFPHDFKFDCMKKNFKKKSRSPKEKKMSEETDDTLMIVDDSFETKTNIVKLSPKSNQPKSKEKLLFTFGHARCAKSFHTSTSKIKKDRPTTSQDIDVQDLKDNLPDY